MTADTARRIAVSGLAVLGRTEAKSVPGPGIDQAMLDAVRDRDAAAPPASDVPTDFGQFARAEAGRLLRTARLLTRDAHDAEDLVQQTFERLQRNWSKVQRATTPAAYVRRVMVNAHLDSIRRDHSGMSDSLDVARHFEPQQLQHPDPSEGLTDAIVLAAALDELSPRYRTAVILRYYLQLSTAEIASTLGIESSSARSLLSRASAQLQRQLSHWNEDI